MKYGLDSLKRCLLCFARRNPETWFLGKMTVILLSIHLRTIAGLYGLLIGPDAVVFVSNKFMSSCVICLVIAREIFLLQSVGIVRL